MCAGSEISGLDMTVTEMTENDCKCGLERLFKPEKSLEKWKEGARPKDTQIQKQNLNSGSESGCAIAATWPASVNGNFVLTCFFVIGFLFCSALHNSEEAESDVVQAFWRVAVIIIPLRPQLPTLIIKNDNKRWTGCKGGLWMQWAVLSMVWKVLLDAHLGAVWTLKKEVHVMSRLQPWLHLTVWHRFWNTNNTE